MCEQHEHVVPGEGRIQVRVRERSSSRVSDATSSDRVGKPILGTVPATTAAAGVSLIGCQEIPDPLSDAIQSFGRRERVPVEVPDPGRHLGEGEGRERLAVQDIPVVPASDDARPIVMDAEFEEVPNAPSESEGPAVEAVSAAGSRAGELPEVEKASVVDTVTSFISNISEDRELCELARDDALTRQVVDSDITDVGIDLAKSFLSILGYRGPSIENTSADEFATIALELHAFACSLLPQSKPESIVVTPAVFLRDVVRTMPNWQRTLALVLAQVRGEEREAKAKGELKKPAQEAHFRAKAVKKIVNVLGFVGEVPGSDREILEELQALCAHLLGGDVLKLDDPANHQAVPRFLALHPSEARQSALARQAEAKQVAELAAARERAAKAVRRVIPSEEPAVNPVVKAQLVRLLEQQGRIRSRASFRDGHEVVVQLERSIAESIAGQLNIKLSPGSEWVKIVCILREALAKADISQDEINRNDRFPNFLKTERR